MPIVSIRVLPTFIRYPFSSHLNCSRHSAFSRLDCGKDVISLDVEEIYFSSISREIIRRLERLKPIENERELDYGDGKNADQ